MCWLCHKTQRRLLPLTVPGVLFTLHRLTLIPAWICNYTHYKVRDEITYPFPYFNGAAIEVWEWISNSSHTLYWACDYLSKLRLKSICISKRGPRLIAQNPVSACCFVGIHLVSEHYKKNTHESYEYLGTFEWQDCHKSQFAKFPDLFLPKPQNSLTVCEISYSLTFYKILFPLIFPWPVPAVYIHN